jgi:OmpA family protein
MWTKRNRSIMIAAIGAALMPAVAAANTKTTTKADAKKCDKLTEVFFAFDSSKIPELDTVALAKVASWAHDHPDAKIVLDGNADVVGTKQYNAVLAAKRATAVSCELIQLGVPKDRIVVVSYGEMAPRRATHAEDRRVTIRSTDESVATIVKESLSNNGVAVVLPPSSNLSQPPAQTAQGPTQMQQQPQQSAQGPQQPQQQPQPNQPPQG